MRSFSTLIAFSVAACAAAAAPPPRTELAYEFLRNGARVAEVVVRFEQDGGGYRLRETWKGRGVYALHGEAVRTSRGRVGPDGLRPEEFEDRRAGRPAERAHFDRATGTLVFEARGERRSEPLAEPAQDRLSLFWTLAFDRVRARLPAAFAVVDGRGVSRQVYEVDGIERLRVPAGEFAALRLARRGDGPPERRIELWLAVERGHVPVRILVIEADGTRLEQNAVRVGLP